MVVLASAELKMLVRSLGSALDQFDCGRKERLHVYAVHKLLSLPHVLSPILAIWCVQDSF